MFGYFRNACMISFYNKKERSGDTNWTISRRRHYLSNLFKYKTCKKLMKPSRQQNSVWYHNWLHHHDASSRVWRYPEFFLVPVLFSGTNFFWDRYQYHPKKGEFSGQKWTFWCIILQLFFNFGKIPGTGKDRDVTLWHPGKVCGVRLTLLFCLRKFSPTPWSWLFFVSCTFFIFSMFWLSFYFNMQIQIINYLFLSEISIPILLNCGMFLLNWKVVKIVKNF